MSDTNDSAKPDHERTTSRREWWSRFINYLKRQRHQSRTKKKPDNSIDRAARRTAQATVLIAIFTIVLAVVGWLQYREIRDSGSDSSGQMNQMLREYRSQVAQLKKQAGDTHDLATRTKDLADRMKDQADQTKILAKHTQDTLTVSERAYVTIGKPDGTVADIIWPKDPTGDAGILVYFQNNGHLPAKFNWGADSPIVAIVPTDPTITAYSLWKGGQTELPTNHLFQPMYRARNSKQMAWSGTIDIAGGSSYQGVLWEVPKERMMELINFENSLLLQPTGMFEYCDGFGKRICRRFNLRYAKEPYNRFFLAMEDECFAMDMQVRHPMPDYEYVAVCSTSERPELQTTIPTLPKPQ